MKSWRCACCGYVVEQEEAPEKCPVCGSDAEAFSEEGE